MAGESVSALADLSLVERALAELPDGEWHVLHDLSLPGGPASRIDHVVIGPAGVFVIETLARSGEIDVSGGELRHNGRRRTKLVRA